MMFSHLRIAGAHRRGRPGFPRLDAPLASFAGLCLGLAGLFGGVLCGQEISPAQPAAIAGGNALPAAVPPVTPTLSIQAEFTDHTRYAVFRPDERPVLWVRVQGTRTAADALVWRVSDYAGRTRASGKFEVPVGAAAIEQRLALGDYGAGYFEISLALERSGVRIPALGSRPAGLVSYAVLPAIQPLLLASSDLSRFGGQGTNFVESGKWMQGDYLSPVYPLTGMHWVYLNRRLHEIARAGEDAFRPVTDPAEFAKKPSAEMRADACVLIDLTGLPDWLADCPSGMPAVKGGHFQSYPPKDWAAYGRLVAKVVSEQMARRKGGLRQAKNYYEIHWEPDWHWKGSDEAFIRMYEVAFKAIHATDPDGMLLGANYGVLATGNRHLERLLAKGLGNYLDGIVTHVYYIPLKQTPEAGGLVQQMRQLKAMTERYLPAGAPIIMSEWGVSDLRRIPKEQEVAWFLRGHLITLGEGARTTFFFYTADFEEAGGLFYNLTAPNPVFGATHIAPKFLFSACAAATRLLEGTSNLGALGYLAPDVLGYAFRRGGEPLLALWSTKPGTKTIRLPFSGDKATFYDPVGNPTIVAPEQGVLTLTISDIPTYLLGGSFADLPSQDASPTVVPSGDAAQKAQAVAACPGGVLPLPGQIPAGTAGYRLWKDGAATPLGADRRISRQAQPGVQLLQAVGANHAVLASWRMEVLPVATLQLAEGTRNAVVVKNQLPEAVKGKLRLLCGETELAAVAAELPANGVVTLSPALDLTKLSATAASELLALWQDADGVCARLHLPPAVPVLSPHRAGKPPVLDGNCTGWDLELFETIDQPAAVKIGAAEWRGAADLSFRLAVRYDDEKLYLALKVRDDSACFRPDREPWDSDSVQIGLATAPDDANHPGLQKLCVAMDFSTGALRLWRHEGKGWKTGELSASTHPIRFVVKRESDETRYEIAIPWSEIGQGWSKPPYGGQLGIGVLVNDCDMIDGEPTKRKAMEAFGGMGWTKASEFGRLLFPESEALAPAAH